MLSCGAPFIQAKELAKKKREKCINVGTNYTLMSPASMSVTSAAADRHRPQRRRQDSGLFSFFILNVH